jgi:hypothetical protein
MPHVLFFTHQATHPLFLVFFVLYVLSSDGQEGTWTAAAREGCRCQLAV